jgi:hypothetical protein
MPPHPNHPCNRCGGQFGDDEAMYMTAVYQPRFRNRIRTAPTCERCLDDDEREIANGQCGVGCLGCRRIMRPLVESFRRSTCGKACQARVERRRPTTEAAAGHDDSPLSPHHGAPTRCPAATSSVTPTAKAFVTKPTRFANFRAPLSALSS